MTSKDGVTESTAKIEMSNVRKLARKDKDALSYQQEIKAMMYACGDVRIPDRHASTYMEQIVHVQMKQLLEKAAEVSRIRGAKALSIEDIVFSLRHSPCKVKKLSNYIVFKDIRSKAAKDVATISTAERKLKYSWLPRNIYARASNLDERLSVVDKITQNMTKEEYLDFTECRQASFTFRKAKRFRDFLDTEHKMKEDVIDVLGFIACEVVFDIISLAGEITAKKTKKTYTSTETHGLFAMHARKSAISIPDIDEACRRLKSMKLLF